jgi:site-specific DNA-adenine methylase
MVDFYPSPKFSKIIEPFAGSARYALKWFDRDILLVDKYPVIIKIWNYLQQATQKDIMSLPEPKYKESIKSYNLAEGELLLLSFLVARGVANSQYIVQQFSDIHAAKKSIASQLFKIRHWRFVLGSYEDIENQDATWFIDPPYQTGGEHYHENNKNIDYSSLAVWCKSRQGQTIVCENTKATWLPFYSMRQMNGAYSLTTEAIWSNLPTDYDAQQLSLFAMAQSNTRSSGHAFHSLQRTEEHRGDIASPLQKGISPERNENVC